MTGADRAPEPDGRWKMRCIRGSIRLYFARSAKIGSGASSMMTWSGTRPAACRASACNHVYSGLGFSCFAYNYVSGFTASACNHKQAWLPPPMKQQLEHAPSMVQNNLMSVDTSTCVTDHFDHRLLAQACCVHAMHCTTFTPHAYCYRCKVLARAIWLCSQGLLNPTTIAGEQLKKLQHAVNKSTSCQDR